MAIDTSAWNDTQLDPLSPPPEDFDGLSVDDAAELIKGWFLDNFEDPVHYVSYISQEGGYQYIWGPYDAAEVISNLFAGVASHEIIKAAIDAIEREGVDWVPSENRIQIDDDRPQPKDLDVKTLHAEMLSRIAALEQALKKVSRPGIGHNQPPEPLDDEPLTAADFQAMSTAISILKAQPTEPAQVPTEAIEAETTLQTIIKKTTTYLAQKGDLFVTEAVKAAGIETGKWATRLVVWTTFASVLTKAVHSVQRGFKLALKRPFQAQ